MPRRSKLMALAAGLVTLAATAAACGTAGGRRSSVSPTPPSAPPTTASAASAVPTSSTTEAPTTTTSSTTSSTVAAPAATTTTTAAVRAAQSACPSNVAQQLASTGTARQLVTVVGAAYNTTYATVELWQRSGSCWRTYAGPWSGRIGVNGFSDHHVEGDGTSPTGLYRIDPTVYGNSPNPGYRAGYHTIVCGDWWDEDPRSPNYNTFQHVACGTTPPFGGGSEALWKEQQPYPSFALVDYNTDPAVPHDGSAIFVHADVGSGTDGCVSVPLSELDLFLRWLDPSAAPAIAMGPASEFSRF